MNELKINGIYKHFKGNYYIVLSKAIDTVTNGDVVVYRALYDDCTLYTRPLEEFLSEVDHKKYPKVKQKYRFELQNIKSNIKKDLQ